MVDLVAAKVPVGDMAKEPMKYEIMAASDGEGCCVTQLVDGNNALGAYALLGTNDLVKVGILFIGSGRSLSLSMPTSKDIANTLFNRALSEAAGSNIKCGCGRETKFKLIPSED